MSSISIVIPAYNEEKRLPATLETVLDYLAARSWTRWEILVVDDGSRDSTAAVARQFESAHPGRVRLLQNPGNRGKGYAVRHGMLEAAGEWMLFTDSDLSAPIEEVDKLLAAAHGRGAAVAIGSRALDRSLIGVHQSWFRETAGRLFNLFMRVMTGLPFMDTQCGFKLFEARAAREIFRRQRIERWGFDAEVLFIARKLGFRAIEVPVRWNHSEGTKISMLRDSLNMFLDLLRIRDAEARQGKRMRHPAEIEVDEHAHAKIGGVDGGGGGSVHGVCRAARGRALAGFRRRATGLDDRCGHTRTIRAVRTLPRAGPAAAPRPGPSVASAAAQGQHDRHEVVGIERMPHVAHPQPVDEQAHVRPQQALLVHHAKAQSRVAPVEVVEQGVERGALGMHLRLCGVRAQGAGDQDLHASVATSTA